ncbi:hypothetical protein EDC96DRAFT_499095 [Choanephora cucurbitarum]|nr:hypothetical protein EDC96DRAFT_499095 [Choanephora cucurbitarum]
MLLSWCTSIFEQKPVPSSVDIDRLRAEVTTLEGRLRSLTEELTVLAFKFLTSFNILTHVERHVLKLTVSNAVDINSEIFANPYRKHLSLLNFTNLQSLQTPIIRRNGGEEVHREFTFFKKLLFEDRFDIMPVAAARRGTYHMGQRNICLGTMKIWQWNSQHQNL